MTPLTMLPPHDEVFRLVLIYGFDAFSFLSGRGHFTACLVRKR